MRKEENLTDDERNQKLRERHRSIQVHGVRSHCERGTSKRAIATERFFNIPAILNRLRQKRRGKILIITGLAKGSKPSCGSNHGIFAICPALATNFGRT